jgi:alkaline phosphatase
MHKLYFTFKIIIILLLTQACNYTLRGVVVQESKSKTLSGIIPKHKAVELDSIQYPTSIIFIIADGTGIGQYTLSYYHDENFAMHRFEHVGLITTHPKDGLKKVTDSAASGTTLATGNKTYNGAIGVDHEQNNYTTVLDWAKKNKKSTGLIATSTISHATPAAFATHVESRRMQAEIAQQLANSDVDLLFGGGKKYWTPKILNKLQQNNVQIIEDFNQSIDFENRVIGLFSDDALPQHNSARLPTTTKMTQEALVYLDQNEQGFFLMVEESQVDWGGHANSAEYIAGEMKSLNELVHYCLDYQILHPEVLVVLTSDHECGGVAVHDGPNGSLDVKFTSDYHSANMVPVFASGPGAQNFDALLDNTDIGKILIEFMK